MIVPCGTDDLHITPQYGPYDDGSQNGETFHSLEEEPEVTPELGCQYLNAKILLPSRVKMAGAKWYVKSMMPMVTLLVDPIRITPLIHTFVRWYFLGVKSQSW